MRALWFTVCLACACGHEVDADDGPRPIAPCARGECPVCEPATCADLGAECGTVEDGCGATLDCGACEAPESCGGEDHPCDCMPATCEELAAECGPVADGCGGALDCGGCEEPQTCGGAGERNRCGGGDDTSDSGGGDGGGGDGGGGSACDGALISSLMSPGDRATAEANGAAVTFELVDVDLSLPQVLLSIAVDGAEPYLSVVHVEEPETTDNGFTIAAVEVDTAARQARICASR